MNNHRNESVRGKVGRWSKFLEEHIQLQAKVDDQDELVDKEHECAAHTSGYHREQANQTTDAASYQRELELQIRVDLFENENLVLDGLLAWLGQAYPF